jgi:hypothetical protein
MDAPKQQGLHQWKLRKNAPSVRFRLWYPKFTGNLSQDYESIKPGFDSCLPRVCTNANSTGAKLRRCTKILEFRLFSLRPANPSCKSARRADLQDGGRKVTCSGKFYINSDLAPFAFRGVRSARTINAVFGGALRRRKPPVENGARSELTKTES